jgi:hypothetical protein
VRTDPEEGAVRGILKILTLLSLLASIGTFIITAVPLFNGQYSTFEHTSVQHLVFNQTDMRKDSVDFSRDSAAKYCIVVMAVCGAGLAVSRIFR